MTTAELLRKIDETVNEYETYARVPANVPSAMRTSAREARTSPTEARKTATANIPTDNGGK